MPARSALAERRKALGLTQESLAEMLRVERSTVARWEQGSATPRPWYRRRLADALQVEPDELGKLLSPRSSHADLSVQAVNGLDIDHDRQPEEHAATIRADARRLVELDTRYGSDDLVQVATRAVRLADQHLACGLVVSRSRRDFHAAVGELARVAAWIAYDAERQPLARQLTTEALMHSRLAGDRQQELFELSQLAMQSIHLGRAGEAMTIGNDVIEDHNPSPRVAAVFHIRRARAWALIGDRTRAMTEHDLAASILLGTSSGSDPDWTWWVDAAELAWHRAMSLAALGDQHAALDLFREAHETRPLSAHRARYNDLAHLVDAQVVARSWAEAESSLVDVLANLGDMASTRTRVILRGTATAIAQAGDRASSTAADAGHDLLTQLVEG
jgi:transcriptional regulator with XRE-family HTH domain